MTYRTLEAEEAASMNCIEDFKAALCCLVPGKIREEVGATDLPFPPSLVQDVTDNDIAWLNETFRFHQSLRWGYAYWTEVFWNANITFLETGKPLRANRIRSELRTLSGRGTPVAPLLLALAEAYLVHTRKVEEIERTCGVGLGFLSRYTLGHRKDAKAEVLFWAYEGACSLIREHYGRHRKATETLFRLWGIPLKEGTRRAHRHRKAKRRKEKA